MDIGANLREAREARGLSIASVAATTRITPRVLEAIERNDLAALPPRTYARGFVAVYAREIGLDPHEIVRTYFAQFEPVPVEPATAASEAAPAEATGRYAWGPALGIVAAAALVVTAGLIAARSGDQAPPEPVAVGTTGSTPAPATAGGVAPASLPRDTVAPAQGRTVPGGRGVSVTLEATGPAWVAATTDGQRSLYQILQPGTTHSLRGEREIGLRVGDAGALKLSVNGRPPQVMGAPGQVLTVRFTPERPAR